LTRVVRAGFQVADARDQLRVGIRRGLFAIEGRPIRDVDVSSLPGGRTRPSAIGIPYGIALLAPLNVRKDSLVHEQPLQSRSQCWAHTHNAITRSGE
jgi:hypothetical protein